MTEATSPRCPWCSAELPGPNLASCPSCGATLTSPTGAEPDIKGVTSLDPLAIIAARAEVGRPRSRILSFITGDTTSDDSGAPENPESLAPPTDDVRREMLRLELEAERADREAETVALKSEVIVEQGIPLATLAAEDGAGTALEGLISEDEAAGATASPAAPPPAPAPVAATPAPPATTVEGEPPAGPQGGPAPA
jgi:hypothetical protein